MIIKDKGLKRRIGVLGLSANIINIIVGSGIFVLPAIVASHMGPASIIAYVFCGFLMAMIMLCFAEVGTKVTNTGGPYTYIEAAFGDYAGFISGFFVIGTFLFADAAVSNALVDVLASNLPYFSETPVKILFLFILFFGLAYINVIGLKQGIGLVKFNTIAKLIPLILLILVGFKDVSQSNLVIETIPSISTLGKTSLILFFAFQGCETGLIIGGEVINPKRTIPRAIFTSIAAVVIIYILVQTISQGILGSELPNYKATPLADTAEIIFGKLGYSLLIIGGIISMFGYMSGSILNSPRVVYALSRDRVIPIKGLSKIHKSFATPYVATIIYASIGFIFAISGSFEQLAVIASSSMLFIYLGVALSVIKLRYRSRDNNSSFKTPGGLLIPIVAILIIFFFLSNISKKEMIGTTIFIVVLSLIYLLNRVFQKK
ncbi:APC family permease [Seonamhaeicola aphaedonensis]|uniref:Amino acid/polyamine/organocation transporter (APC superfamily) n=1 Tax=Seonamhaeicola aphaedonensis TaxID=1461338 RepID=A0A3D9H639_9FLAO|nr:amino acid permease [Seonamhaeicola aphaedonensis]RED44970.1 amino acid/polyamine/organocation transporter (APC superfamily) [Seonamhaeicola aphaedonensis]